MRSVTDPARSTVVAGAPLPARVAIITFAFLLVLYQRFVLEIDTGGRGILPVLQVLFPVVVLAFVVLPSNGRALGYLRDPTLWVYWSPYLMLSFILPMLGVIASGYPPRTLSTLLQRFVVPLSAITLGYRVAIGREATFVFFRNSLWSAIVLLVLYTVAVLVGQFGLLDISFVDALVEWDWSLRQAYWEEPNRGRAVGTFMNPNILGFSAVIMLWHVWLTENGRRVVAGTLGLAVVLLLSQSRGAFAALGVSAVVFVASRAATAARASGQLSLGTIVRGGAILAAIGLATFVASQWGPWEQITERVASGVAILVRGPAADAAFQTRVDAWSRALLAFGEHPVGTFGPSGLKLGFPPDNEFVRILLQGSLPYLASYLWMLWGGMRELLSNAPGSLLLAVLSVAILVEAITALPLAMGAIALFWFQVGYVSGCRRHPVCGESP